MPERGQGLEVLRGCIDHLDEALAILLAMRMGVTGLVGVIKARDGLSVVDPDRERQRLEAVETLGAELGLPEGFMARVIRTVMDESVRQQEKGVASWNNGTGLQTSPDNAS